MNVELELNPAVAVELAATRRRAMLAAGREVLLPASIAMAPREPEPRHGVHLADTGFVRIELGAEGEQIEVGYEAFWAVWQHEKPYKHPHGGSAKFLEIPMLENGEAALEFVAAAMREAMGE